MDGQYIIIVLENPLAFALNFFLLRHQLPRNQGKKKKKKTPATHTQEDTAAISSNPIRSLMGPC
ncbi:hypothetical protein ACKS0A_06083 [Histoplasma ohiense]